MAELPTIRVFVSSPSDVRPERLIVDRVAMRLAREFSYHARIETVLWEREPLVAAHHFQDIQNIPPPRSCDIVLVILWSRLGVPLPKDRFKGAMSGGPVTGTEWEFEDALAAYHEKGLPELLLYRKKARVSADLDDEHALEDARQQRRQVDAFLKRWFVDAATGSFILAFHEFTDTVALEDLVETHLREMIKRRLERMGPEAGVEEGAPLSIRYAGAPFRGLLSFELEHASVFFGRGQARHELRELLTRQAERGAAFVLVLGASGSGKSSLVKAGLLPDLKLPGMVGRVALCRHAIIRPSDGNGDPLLAIAAGLLADTALPELKELSWEPDGLKELLATAPNQAVTALRQGLAVAHKKAGLTERAEGRLALVIDQFEELFTQEQLSEESRRGFVKALESLARSGLVWVIATMRGDFFDRLGTVPGLAELSAEGRYLLTPPTEAEIGQIILGPTREAGCRFEVDKDGIPLDETIRQAARDVGALPLLSFLLDQLWRGRRNDGTLCYETYRSLGGLEGSLGRRAEEVYQSQPPEVQQALPAVLRSLVTIGQGEGSAPTARTEQLARFPAGTPKRALIDAFLRPEARLLVADGDTAGARIRVAHEALLTHWPRAKELIEHDRADLQVRTRLEQATALWRAAGPKDQNSLLLRDGLPLSEVQDLISRRRDELDTDIVRYAEASSAHVLATRNRALKRARMVAAGLGTLAVAAAGSAWYAIQQQRVAELNFIAADRNHRIAVEAADSLVKDVAERLRPLAGVSADTVREILGRAESIFDRLGEAGEPTSEALQHRAEMLNSFAETFEALGDTKEWSARATAARDILLRLTAQDPRNVAWQGDLSVSHDKIGDAFRAQGDLSAALKAYGEGMAIRARLASQDASNARWRRDLSVSHEKTGVVLELQGDLAGALKTYREGLGVIQGLATQDPGNADWQRNLALIHSRIGNVLRAQGDLAGALTSYRDALAIRQSLAAQDPRNGVWQRDLAVANERIGDVHQARGDLSAAFASYRDSGTIRARLAAQDPRNTTWQRDLSVSYNKIGNVLQARGNAAEALKAYRGGLAIRERLVGQDPANAEWQRDLSVSMDNVGDALHAQGDLQEALKAYRDSLAVRERLVARDSDNATWLSDVSMSHNKIGNTLHGNRDLTAALASYRAGHAIRVRLAARDPQNAGWRRDLWASHQKIGAMLQEQGDLAGALASYRDGLAVIERLTAQDPLNAGWQRDLILTLGNVGGALLKSAKPADALAVLERGVALAEARASRAQDSARESDLAWIRRLRDQAQAAAKAN